MKNFAQQIIVTSIAIILLSACSKASPKEVNPENQLKVKEFAEKLILDDEFQLLLKSINTGTMQLNQLGLYNLNGINKIDSATKIEITHIDEKFEGDLVNFLINHKSFVGQSHIDRIKILEFIKDSILSISYLEEKSNISMQLISANDSLLNNSTCSNQQKFKTLDAEFRNKSSKITSNVLIGCAISILISAIGYYQSAIDDIAYIMTQGFTGTALFSLAFDIIKNASPWWKAAAILVSFGACVLPSIE
jgi:hypothetical protein